MRDISLQLQMENGWRIETLKEVTPEEAPVLDQMRDGQAREGREAGTESGIQGER